MKSTRQNEKVVEEKFQGIKLKLSAKCDTFVPQFPPHTYRWHVSISATGLAEYVA